MDLYLGIKLAAVLLSFLAALALARGDAGKTTARRPPAAFGIPWFGDSFAFVRDPVGLLKRRHTALGEVYSNVLMGQRFIHVGGLANIKKLLAAEGDLVKGATPLSFALLLGPESLAATHGKEHRALRQMLVPAFTQRAIAGYLPRISRIFNAFIDDWVRRGDVSGGDELTAATFKVAIEVILGFDDGWCEPERFKTVQAAWRQFLIGLFSAPFWWLSFVPGSGLYNGLKARKYVLDLTSASLDIIQGRIDSGQLQLFPESANVGHTILTHTREDGKAMPRSQAMDLCMNTLFAGHETTAKAIMCLLLTLKQHPAELDRLAAEQREVIARHGPEISEAALRDMERADACAREILRLYPIAAAAIRDALRDFELDGFQIRKGDQLWLNLRRVTRDNDPRWLDGEFPPQEFVPQRWFSERGRLGSAQLSFGGGPRMCLGMTLAYTELKVLTVLMVRRVDWRVDLAEQIVAFPITHPGKGLPMRVTAKAPADAMPY